jgi:hypothetical protein
VCNPVSVAHPELLLAKGVHEGLEWEVTSNLMGYRCGYVRVPPGHPWHGRDYDDVDASVHGGLTFAQPDLHCGKGGADDAWWLGFDCAHCGDAPDPGLPGCERWPAWHVLEERGVVRTTAYVEEQCRLLIGQALQAKPGLRARRLSAQELR